jgi:hypothetical protein
MVISEEEHIKILEDRYRNLDAELKKLDSRRSEIIVGMTEIQGAIGALKSRVQDRQNEQKMNEQAGAMERVAEDAAAELIPGKKKHRVKKI